MKSYLVFVRGLPGGGKSYISDRLEEKIGKEKVVKLDPDATDYSSEEYLAMCDELRSQGVDEKLYPYRFLRSQAFKGIEDGKVVLWNQAFTNPDTFKNVHNRFAEYATEKGIDLSIHIVEVEIDPELAKKRISERASSGGHDVPAERFAKFVEDYASFEGEGYNVVSVRGDDDTEATCDMIIRGIGLSEE